jgi:aminoglycoside phosphotransferase (APT) family kinase protein
VSEPVAGASEALDLGALNAWLAVSAPALGEVTAAKKFPGGFSNLTYQLETTQGRVVLRRPPAGVGPGVAHDMVREHRILTLLAARGIAAPRPLAVCEDSTVLGAPFYMMAMVDGVILRGAPEPVPAAEVMRGVSESFVQTLVGIHAIRGDDPIVASLGKGEGYVARQVGGWTGRWAKSKTDEVPAMDALAARLVATQPVDAGVCLVHNDFKYDNLVLARDDWRRVVAVLDWEMATVGDPLLDVGTTLGYWVEAGDHPVFRSLGLGATAVPGSFTRAELWARYLELTGRAWVEPGWYHAFGVFKIAVIAQQIYARYRRGMTADERFAGLGEVVRVLGEVGMTVMA